MKLTAPLQTLHRLVAPYIPEGAAMLESHRVRDHRLPEGHTSGRSHQTAALSEYYLYPGLPQDPHQAQLSLADSLSARQQNQSEMIRVLEILAERSWGCLVKPDETELTVHQQLMALVKVRTGENWKNFFVLLHRLTGWTFEQLHNQTVPYGFHFYLMILPFW